MKLLFVIDSLGSGGAQKQMVSMACGLKEKGHEVELFNYYPEHSFYRPMLEDANIKIIDFLGKKSGFSMMVVSKLVETLRKGKYDLALAYLNSPSLYLELSHLISPHAIKVVSERNSIRDYKKRGFLRHFHRFAKCVVVNSNRHCSDLVKEYPYLKAKTKIIYNGVNVTTFKPEPVRKKEKKEIRLLGVGRISPQKNIINLIKSLDYFYQSNQWAPELNWIGRVEKNSKAGISYWESVKKLLKTLPAKVHEKINFHGEQKNIQKWLTDSDALISASYYEGLSNVICEALACGKPVLASDVSDNKILIEHGSRGFLFQPELPISIAETIRKFTNLKPDRINLMSRNCRTFAETHLSEEKMVNSYETLFENLIASEKSVESIEA